MEINSSDLERFEIDSVLGEGAELQAFAALDRETGAQVVIKRPHPAMIRMSQHQGIEARMAKIVQLRNELGDSIPSLPRLIAHTIVEPNSSFFGDSISETYAVLVEERATGLPLVGSTIDGIRKMPIGIPQNIFAIHPLVPHSRRGAFSVQRDILDLVEAFYNAGYLLLDLTPQNVFFDPREARITVIDIGNLTVEQEATRRRDPIDLHDFYLEMFKWYVPSSDVPQTLDEYAIPSGMDSVPVFRQSLDGMLNRLAGASQSADRDSALYTLQKIRQRAYTGLDDFRKDFDAHLSLLEEKCNQMSCEAELPGVWNEALNSLNDDYWRKFIFDPDNDLTFYRRD